MQTTTHQLEIPLYVRGSKPAGLELNKLIAPKVAQIAAEAGFFVDPERTPDGYVIACAKDNQRFSHLFFTLGVRQSPELEKFFIMKCDIGNLRGCLQSSSWEEGAGHEAADRLNDVCKIAERLKTKNLSSSLYQVCKCQSPQKAGCSRGHRAAYTDHSPSLRRLDAEVCGKHLVGCALQQIALKEARDCREALTCFDWPADQLRPEDNSRTRTSRLDQHWCPE